MARTVDKIAAEIRRLSEIEKLRLVDAILADLEKPHAEIDRVWAEEPANVGRPTKPVESRRYLTSRSRLKVAEGEALPCRIRVRIFDEGHGLVSEFRNRRS